MSFKNFFYFSYWFSQPDPAVSGVRALWIVIFLAMVVFGATALIIRAWRQENATRLVLGRLASAFFTLGLLGLLWFAFRQENVSFLSWRLWMGLWAVAAVVWFGSIVRYTIGRIPRIKAENKERELREKYLPKPKK